MARFPSVNRASLAWFRPDLESLKNKANHSFHSQNGLQPILSNGIGADGLLQDPTESLQAIALDSGHQRQVHLADSLARILDFFQEKKRNRGDLI